ncbi:hypothetical protein E2C01_096030 [Portunus trituberculatus]|uniref:Uncharacterized protein n=1 Tax=Portunus trituberculatus TaxID=210409 RepID=A0A5B7JRK9_PORTR|nr:hypothetical protein [Portunus trituberculatus]
MDLCKLTEALVTCLGRFQTSDFPRSRTCRTAAAWHLDVYGDSAVSPSGHSSQHSIRNTGCMKASIATHDQRNRSATFLPLRSCWQYSRMRLPEQQDIRSGFM